MKSKPTQPAIVSKSHLKQLNKNKNWKIRVRYNDVSETWQLYVHQQRVIQKDGRQVNKSDYHAPKKSMLIYGDDYEADAQVLENFKKWRDREGWKGNKINGLDPDGLMFIDFLDIIIKEKKEDNKKTPVNHTSLKYQWELFTDGYDYLLSEIDEELVLEFRKYLRKQHKTNSVWKQLNTLRSTLNTAIKKKLIFDNPAADVKEKFDETTPRNLEIDELYALEQTLDKNNPSELAYLFCVFTGLRLSEVESVSFEDIASRISMEGMEYKILIYNQQKTGKPLSKVLPPSALQIIYDLPYKTGLIFRLKSRATIQNDLAKWWKRTGIPKFTFHSSRHTWSNLNDIIGNEISYISAGLGHASISMTQNYLKSMATAKQVEPTQRFEQYLKNIRKTMAEIERTEKD